MNQKQRLRLTIMLSLASTLAFTSPMISQAANETDALAAPAKVVAAQSLTANQLPMMSQDIKILPINQAKLWRGQHFDLEVELPSNIKEVSVTINGEDAAKALNDKATVTDKGTHLSYRIDDAAFTAVGPKAVKVLASDGTNTYTRTVNYEVVNEVAQKKAKNVILFVGDGMSLQAKEMARILSKGLSDGKFNDVLNMEKMPNMALITTSGYDSIVTDSANSASAYNTGNKSVVNAMGVYENSTPDPLDDPKVETIAEMVSRSKGMSYGMVTTAAVTDATPAAVTAHTRRRAEQNYIANDFINRTNPPAVVMGGGAQFFLPLDTPGSKRKDNINVIQEFKDKGYQFAGTKTELEALSSDKPILGLFQLNTMNVYMDRAFLPTNEKVLKGFTDQPGLVEMTKKAIEVLEKNPNGFFLMSEGASIDKQLHAMDWQRATYDAIELDQAVKYAQEYSKAHGDNTLIIVVADHAHGVSITGTYSEAEGKVGREAVRVYGDAKWPTFVDANNDGFPDNPDADVTLAVQYANAPDHYENYRFQTTPHDPATAGKDGHVIANPNRAPQGARLVEGNLPTTTGETSEVHSADDVVLMAQGPGSEYFHGVMDNTEVFFGIMRALGVDATKNPNNK
ncbi:MAG: alkaline phosphatase [Veillonella sp.]|uniref:alkaline phosphatase n=1 Tax=Veillonella sp. TaxID=1926307 RepID=UPI0025E94DED|nr:alkaline phosphatase [Veillonella sp.]MBS4913903.1 alkaline phosphatase [Veillonella sp.]